MKLFLKLALLCVSILPSLGFATSQLAITNLSKNSVLLGFMPLNVLGSDDGNARCGNYGIPNQDVLLAPSGVTTCSFSTTQGSTNVRLFVYSVGQTCRLLCTFKVTRDSPIIAQGKEHCSVQGSQVLLINS